MDHSDMAFGENGESLGEGFDLDLAAASLRSSGGDVSVLLEALVGSMADVLGERLQVDRSKGLRRSAGKIRAVAIRMGDDELRAEISGPLVQCTIGHTSGGIRIRTNTVDMQIWLKHLLQALQHEAAHSEAAQLALEQLLIGGST